MMDSLNLFNILTPAIFTIFGVYLGYVLSIRHWKHQLDYQKENIAMGFYNEIGDLQKIINPIMRYYKLHKPTVGHAYYLKNVIDETKVDLNENKSLYDNYGLYFLFHKEIYNFDKELIKKIIIFYKNFLQAEECYKNYMKLCTSNDYEWNLEKLKMQDYFFDYLGKTQPLISDLQESLSDQYS